MADKEEAAGAETSWQWWTDYKGESFSPHIMLYGPNGTRMLGNGVAIALELTRLEAEVKALKPLAELAADAVPFVEWVSNSRDLGASISEARCWLIKMAQQVVARYDSALKAQGEQSNPIAEEER